MECQASKRQVRTVISKESGKEYACKSICKRLDIPNLSIQRQAAHLENIEREIKILRKLRGALNVVHLKGAYEDDEHIHIVMEYCRGGELLHHISSTPHYTERTVASFMRGVLRTIMQCHSHNILHRDVKPGNFMLLDERERSPIKAIDFGLAVFFDPEKLPRTDLGLEGTPWFMAPEALSSKVYPASDVWAAGVMAYQLLSGRLPFDDRRNPNAPALSLVWKSVLTEEPPFKGKTWVDISDEAKDFVKQLLNKDPEKRPTAREALQHPWLAGGTTADRGTGAPLRHTVVQRIQRFAQGVAQGNALRRSIFELIANELIKEALESPHGSSHDGTPENTPPSSFGALESRGGPQREGMLRPISAGNLLKLLVPERAASDGAASRKRPLSASADMEEVLPMKADRGPGGGAIEGPPLLSRTSMSAHGGMEYYKARGESVHGGKDALDAMDLKRANSIHGGGSYWRIMRAAAEASRWPSRSGLLGRTYLHCVPRTASEKQEQEKVSRLALDTSVHGSKSYHRLVRQITRASSNHLDALEEMPVAEVEHPPERIDTDSYPTTPEESDSEAGRSGRGKEPAKCSPAPLPPIQESYEQGRRSQGAYKAFLESGQVAYEKQPESPAAAHEATTSGAKSTEPSTFGSTPFAAAQPSPPTVDAHPSCRTPDTTMSPDDKHAHATLGAQPPFPSPRNVTFADQEAAPTESLPEATPPRNRSVTFADTPADDDDQMSLASAMSSDSTATQEDTEGDVSMCGSEGEPEVQHGASPEDRLPLAPIRTDGAAAMRVDFSELRDVLRRLNFSKEAEVTTGKALAEGLAKLGYKLEPGEMKILMQSLAGDGGDVIPKGAFVASQLDWHVIQQDYKEAWLSACRRVFADLDKNKDNALKPSEDLVAILNSKLPREEIEYAVEDALQAAGIADAESLDFEGFLRIVGQEGSMNELEQYEARHTDASQHGASHHGSASLLG